MVLSLPFLYSEEGKHLCRRGATHFINGMANIVAGAFEAIPLVGSVIAGYRMLRSMDDQTQRPTIYTGQEHMVFVGYRILEEQPCRFQDLNDISRNLESVMKEGADLKTFNRTSPLITV